MADKAISYLKLGNQLYFSPFAYTRHSFGYPWNIIGSFDIYAEKGCVCITPIYGTVTLQLKLTTYSHLTFFREPIFDLFNVACNYKLVNAEIKMVYSNYRDINVYKPNHVDHVNVFESYNEILDYYNSRGIPFAMIHVSNDTYNVFTFVEANNE